MPGCSNGNYKRKKSMTYSEKSILDDLDDCGKTNPYKFFPDLGHGYFALSGSRVSLFADKDRWAIVFEKTGYANREYSVKTEILYFGNCLKNLDKVDEHLLNVKYVQLCPYINLSSIMDKRTHILQNADSISIRSEKIPIIHSTQLYSDKGIVLKNDSLDIVSLTRLLEEFYPLSFRATDSEIRQCLPNDLPKIMTIDQWHQESYTNYGVPQGVLPSQQEAYQLMAKVLVTKDTSLFKPTLKPNNDWRFWPDSGGL
jgi:hypothetical protein